MTCVGRAGRARLDGDRPPGGRSAPRPAPWKIPKTAKGKTFRGADTSSSRARRRRGASPGRSASSAAACAASHSSPRLVAVVLSTGTASGSSIERLASSASRRSLPRLVPDSSGSSTLELTGVARHPHARPTRRSPPRPMPVASQALGVQRAEARPSRAAISRAIVITHRGRAARAIASIHDLDPVRASSRAGSRCSSTGSP